MNLRGKVFVKGLLQVAKYDEAYNALLNYIGSTYYYRVYNAFEYKDRAKGDNLITKPIAPMMTKVVQIASVGGNITLTGIEVQLIDKTGEPYE